MKIFISLLFWLLLSLSICSQIYLDIDVHAAKDTIETNVGNSNFTILDVRTAEEYLPEHIAGAFNRDFYEPDFELQLDSLDKSRTYLIYCKSGNRSGQTLATMEDLGFQTVYNILGGMNDWNSANYAVTDVIPPYTDIYQNMTGLYQLEINSISIFPNPSMHTITLDLSEKDLTFLTYQVISQNGKEVLSGKLNRSFSIDLSFINNGCYRLLLYTDKTLFGATSIIKY
ncbi:rhodanese-like domain-containing protein [Chitinophagales bacterium]|nr:rhodanese-like domain-containing protein [Chitinophagales bacterium]